MDQGKIDTNRAVFGFEDELKAYLIAFALEYASLRNRAESDAYNKWQSENREQICGGIPVCLCAQRRYLAHRQREAPMVQQRKVQ